MSVGNLDNIIGVVHVLSSRPRVILFFFFEKCLYTQFGDMHTRIIECFIASYGVSRCLRETPINRYLSLRVINVEIKQMEHMKFTHENILEP